MELRWCAWVVCFVCFGVILCGCVVCFERVDCAAVCVDVWALSSNGRAPASHAGGRGIDTPSVHFLRYTTLFTSRHFLRASRCCLPVYQPTYSRATA
ncbi:hypothetical protein PF007_g32529 [Phytophthora fragariae]|uniref:Secreted protein n=1 Tax=Phytophthora fragariae TaxID=53985 RepID=A0A6A3PN23_9STRA|nr:hypothetical protein PF007_g32529 [Phytophthora fragariae]